MGEGATSADRALHLPSLLTEQTVRAQVSVASWQEAVERVGELLVGSGAVETRYIESMKRVLSDMGPYAAIAPGIVLLHARPEDGVRRPCLAMITLATPVPFGHSQNDPVDLVVALGAVDKKAHITALQELAELLMDRSRLERIRSAMDEGALLAAVGSRDDESPAGGGQTANG